MSKKTPRFLFAGCGSIGRRHIRNLKGLIPSCEILAYRVRNEDLGEFGTQYDVKTFNDLDEALDQKPSALFVTNPTALHLPVARKAAERGVHLFIEKPISHTLEGVDEFIALCERKKIVVLLGYKMRFHRSIQRIKRIIDDGLIGRIVSARSHYGGYLPNWHPWEDYRRMYSSRSELGGGIVLDATHEIDYLYWLAGDVAEVKSFSGKLGGLEIDTEDTAEILFRFKSGAFGNVHLTYLQHPESRSCEVIGTEGTVLWNQNRKAVELYTSTSKKWELYPEGENYTLDEMFVDEMNHFLACIEGREKPIHTLQDSKRVLEIALKVKESQPTPSLL